MNNQYLSISRFIRSKIISTIADLLPTSADHVNSSHAGYILQKKPDAVNFRKNSTIGIFTDRIHQWVVIKDYAYTWHGLDFEYLHNEIAALTLLNTPSMLRPSVRIPVLILAQDSGHQITIITKYMPGTPLSSHSKKDIKLILPAVYRYFWDISEQKSNRRLSSIPVRKQYLSYLLYPIYAMRAILRNSSITQDVLAATRLFYQYVRFYIFSVSPYVLTHRDISPDNVLYDVKTKKATVLDPECMCQTAKLHDLSSMPRMFVRLLSASDMMEIITALQLSQTEKKELIVLILSNNINKIATEAVNSRDYKNAVDAQAMCVQKLIPKIVQSL